MPSVMDYFIKSPYFDRTRNGEKVEIILTEKVKNNRGVFEKTEISRETLVSTFYSNVSGNKVNQNYLNKYNIFKYLYTPTQLTLQSAEQESIILINGEEFEVLEDRKTDLTSGFWKYLVGGTGKNGEY